MARDILEAIKSAEEECKIRELYAKKSAQEKIISAEAEAKRLIAEAAQNAEREAQSRYESAKADGDKELNKARQASDNKCAQIHKFAEINRQSVIENAVKYLLN